MPVEMLSSATSQATTAELPMVLHARVITGEGGGPEKTILNSPRFLPELGYTAACAYLHPPGDAGFEIIRQRARQWSASLIEIEDRGALDFSVLRKLRTVCREQNVAVWHGHDYKSNLIGLLLRRSWPMKLVTTVHGWVKHTWRTPLYYAIDRLCLRWYDRVICVSDDLRDASIAAGARRDKCLLIENAIDTTQFRRKQSVIEAKRRLGFATDRKLIGAVGRLSPEKGFDVLIESVAQLRREGCEVDLAIAGEGDDRARLTALIATLGLEQHVRLLGYRSDTIALYEALDVFALSSYREGLPNVVLEAMALETPVVATSIAGVPKLVTAGHDGLLVPPGDASALAAALREVLSDDALHRRLTIAGRSTVEERFSFHRRMRKVAQVYDEVLATGTSS